MKRYRTFTLAALLAVVLSSLTACGGNNSTNNAATNAAAGGASANAMASTAPMQSGSLTPPNCGAVQAVWVNQKTRKYHEPGDPYYGKTKHGEYLCPNQAKAQGFRPAGHRHAAAGSSM